MGDLIRELLARLKTITELQTVTVWNNQFEYIEDGSSYSFAMPCAFVEVNFPDGFRDLACNYQETDVEIRIHIGQDYYNGVNIDENLSIFDLRDLVVKSMSHFQTTKSGLLVKINEGQDFDHRNVYHYTIDFKTQWIDETAVKGTFESTPPTGLIINKV